MGVGAQRVENFLSQKCFPAYFFRKNASQIGLSIPKVTAPLSYQRQRSPKRANESERAIKTRVQGGALVFFPPTFFKESRAPPRSSAGDSRCRVHLATVPTEPPTDGRGSRPSFSPFLGRNGDPRRAGGATGRCAPRQLRICPPEGYAGPAALGPRPHLPMETVSHFGNKPKTLSQQVGGILIPTRFLRGPDCRPQRESAAR